MNEQEVRKAYHRLTVFLIEHHLTITTMESITSGQIASLITDTEGASAVMKGAFITYSNEAKIRQGVPEEVIRKYGVYSRETARAMAEACRKAYPSDIAVGITGSAGNPDPANRDSVPGEVYYAVWYHGRMTDGYFVQKEKMTRLSFKLYAAGEVVRTLYAVLGIK